MEPRTLAASCGGLSLEAVHGVATARAVACLPHWSGRGVLEHMYVALGPGLARCACFQRLSLTFPSTRSDSSRGWEHDGPGGWRLAARTLALHDDVVTCLLALPPPPAGVEARPLLASFSFGGEVALWEEEESGPGRPAALRRACPPAHVGRAKLTWAAACAAAGGPRVLTYSEDAGGMVACLEVAEGPALRLLWTREGAVPLFESDADGLLVAVRGSRGGEGYSIVRTAWGTAEEWDAPPSASLPAPAPSFPTTIVRDPSGRRFAVPLLDRSVHVYGAGPGGGLEPLWTVPPCSSGFVRSVVLEDSGWCLVPTDSGYVQEHAPGGALSRKRRSARGVVHFLAAAPPDAGSEDPARRSLVACTEAAVHIIPGGARDEGGGGGGGGDLPSSHCVHEVACCGVDLFPSGDRVASGDLAGNLVVWDCGAGACAECRPAARASVPDSVRCVCVLPDGTVLAGCLDGGVFAWDPAGPEAPAMAVKLDGSVTVLKARPGPSSGPGGARGDAGVEPVAGHERPDAFGSLHAYAEVWSLAWSPCGERLATCSEDQSVRVWSAGALFGGGGGRPERTLGGHTAAVTSVDWARRRGDGRPLLASCSDDRTVRVWGAEGDWPLLAVYDTFGYVPAAEWHTLTYLSLGGGDALACAAQNGFLFLWTLPEGDGDGGAGSAPPRVARKVHTGSVEGLAWRGRRVATCSSDCTVAVHSATRPEPEAEAEAEPEAEAEAATATSRSSSP
eukprot:tig00020943_g16267.t1